MQKVNVQLVNLGSADKWLDFSKVLKWKSRLFQVLPTVDRYSLPARAAGPFWDFTDRQISRSVPRESPGNFMLVVTDAPLEGNFYMRRLTGNRVCISLFQVKDILAKDSIPLENYVLKCVYEVLVLYTSFINNDNELPVSEVSITHDATKGCLFDMTGNKGDLIPSCKAPSICDTCYADFSRHRVPVNILDSVRHELWRVRIPMYYRITAFIHKHPILSLTITIITGVGLNLLANFIWTLF